MGEAGLQIFREMTSRRGSDRVSASDRQEGDMSREERGVFYKEEPAPFPFG